MYSGSTFTTYSGRIMGAHQKIDRLARRDLERLLPRAPFPSISRILHFEGGNGPDAIKRKSPAKDEPWHYFQPDDVHDTQLIELIEQHYKHLVQALRKHDEIRAAFEAAWLAHAIVDGLTPAHHYPYEEKLEELRGGQGKETRTTIKEKLVMHGDSRRDQLKNNWKMWGPKGLFLTHSAFEIGFAVLLAPMRLRWALPNKAAIEDFESKELGDWFRETAQDIVKMELYDTFYKTGWTIPLARKMRRRLAPVLIRSVALVWYSAAREADHKKGLWFFRARHRR